MLCGITNHFSNNYNYKYTRAVLTCELSEMILVNSHKHIKIGFADCKF